MKLTPQIVGDGFVSRYLDFVAQHEAPQSYHLASLVTLFSSLLERRLVIKRGYTIRANIFTVLYGPPAVRKTYTTRIVRQIFKDAGYEIETVGENATDEGVLKAMIAKEHVGQSPTATIICEEFGVLLGKKKYQEGMAQWLCRAYDGGALRNERSAKSYGASDSFVTLLAATTPKGMRTMSENLLETGLSSRLWVIAEMRQAHFTWRPKFDREQRTRLATEFAGIVEPLMGVELLEFDPPPAADDTFEDWYMGEHRRMVETAEEVAELWVGRRHDHAVRAAVLLHLLDGKTPESFDAEAARRGIAFIEAMEPGMFAAYGSVGSSQWGITREKIVAIIKRKGNGGIELRHLMSAMSRWIEPASQAQAALKDILASGECDTKGAGGKMRIVWREHGPATDGTGEETGDGVVRGDVLLQEVRED